MVLSISVPYAMSNLAALTNLVNKMPKIPASGIVAIVSCSNGESPSEVFSRHKLSFEVAAAVFLVREADLRHRVLTKIALNFCCPPVAPCTVSYDLRMICRNIVCVP